MKNIKKKNNNLFFIIMFQIIDTMYISYLFQHIHLDDAKSLL